MLLKSEGVRLFTVVYAFSSAFGNNCFGEGKIALSFSILTGFFHTEKHYVGY